MNARRNWCLNAHLNACLKTYVECDIAWDKGIFGANKRYTNREADTQIDMVGPRDACATKNLQIILRSLSLVYN